MAKNFGLECTFITGTEFLRNQREETREALESAGFGGEYRSGVIIEAAVDTAGKTIILCVDEVSQDGDVFTARQTDVRLTCESTSAALSTLGGLRKGLHAAFDNDCKLIAVVTDSFND